MWTPLVESFDSDLSPWQIYRNLYRAGKVSYFLDSSRYNPPDQTYSYLGINPFLEVVIESRKKNPSLNVEVREGGKTRSYPKERLLSVLRNVMKRFEAEKKFDFFAGGAVGYWGYELCSIFDGISLRNKKDSDLPVLYLGLFRETVVYDHRTKKYYLTAHFRKGNLRSRKHACEGIAHLKTFFTRENGAPEDFHLLKFRPEQSRTDFEKIVRRAKNYIAAGDMYQANLSQRFSFSKSGSSLKLYESLRKINPSPFASFLKIGHIEIISSSPERLIQKRGSFCQTRPIAGTRPRKTVDAGTTEMQRELLTSPKERAEHIMLVDLERNDLGRVCDWRTVRVEELMTVEKYSHVIHIVSNITGRLQKEKDAFDLIKAMFPGGTITGCPKIRCMEIIDELEPVHRGIYTGSIGYLDFSGDLDLNIVIRTLVLKAGKGYLQVGAGIVHDSEPSREYDETIHKGQALVEALAKASGDRMTRANGSRQHAVSHL